MNPAIEMHTYLTSYLNMQGIQIYTSIDIHNLRHARIHTNIGIHTYINKLMHHKS